jgi:hypothetical protein
VAIGSVVKTLIVRFRADGAASVRGDMNAIAARAAEISKMDFTIRMTVADRQALERLRALRLEMALLRAAGDKVGLARVANEMRILGDNATAPVLKTAALRSAMMALNATLAGGGTAAAGGAAGGIGALGTAGAIAGVVALLSGAGGLIPALAGAGLAVAAFGALAIPTFTAVFGAVSKIAADTTAYQAATTAAARSTALAKIKADWAALTPGQAAAVKGIQALQTAFGNLATAIQPLALKLLNDGLKIAAQLLPALLPLAQAGGKALTGLADNAVKFFQLDTKTTKWEGFGRSLHAVTVLNPTPFGQFVQLLTKLSGPTITTMGEGFGKVAIALGKLMIALANPNALRIAKYTFDAIAGIITFVAWAMDHATARIIQRLHEWAVWFDQVRRFFAQWGHDVAHNFDSLRHTVASVAHDISHYFDNVRHAAASMANWVAGSFDKTRHAAAVMGHDIAASFDATRHAAAVMGHDIAHWFDVVRHTIASFASSAGHLLWQAGADLLRGLVGGISSMIGSVISSVTNIGSSILGGIKHALGLGSPSRITYQHGLWLAEGLALGMDAGAGHVGAAAMRMARGAIPGGGAYGGGGGGVLRLEVVGHGGGMLDQLFISWLKNYVRVTGGGGPTSVQRSLGQVWR